ncbi:MAG TPA: helix-turn-helix domain-containing protein [Gaiellaceae bacterium]|nr:helix-turn-helix domain-containing protein [Gaiellaceae bacterium]
MIGQIAPEQPRTWHKALADDSRTRIVEELRDEPGGLDSHELGRRLELHPNTVRWHLGILGDAGIVSGRRAERRTPGRPRTVYTIRADAGSSGKDEFRLLASVLTTAVARLPDAASMSEAAGREWGRYLAPRRSPLATRSEEESVADVVRLLDEQGFAPEEADGEIRLRRCPFLDLAEQHPEVVCSVHRGLLAGALDGQARDVEVELEPFAGPSLCLVRLRGGS